MKTAKQYWDNIDNYLDNLEATTSSVPEFRKEIKKMMFSYAEVYAIYYYKEKAGLKFKYK